MNPHPHGEPLPSAQRMAIRVLSAIERFLHIEAMSGIVLLIAAAAALIWANSPFAESYSALWHAPLSISLGGLSIGRPLEFWINEGLMTIFFLVVGLEIRREMQEGALSNARLATLPLAAAFGGIAVPALIYLAINRDPLLAQGWAIPTATDIAFAVGVLALLGKLVPAPVRVLLLALAVIDDIAAVIVIALFYSSGLEIAGLFVGAAGVVLVLVLQSIGVRAALPYVVPGAILWFGLLSAGVHPTLAGVALGLLAPTTPWRRGERPVDVAGRALGEFEQRARTENHDLQQLIEPLRRLRDAQRELLPPVVRVQMALHPWVAFGVMPLFALANAGIPLGGLSLADITSHSVALGIFCALLFGKPIGIVLASWIAVRLGWCSLPAQVGWRAVLLVGCLGGIGFTMSIFIAMLAFEEQALLDAAKLGVLLASTIAGIVGLLLGRALLRRPVRQVAVHESVAMQPAPPDRRS